MQSSKLSFKNLTNDDYDRVVMVESPKILEKGERFILENKMYTNPDQSIFIASTFATGKIFAPLSTPARNSIPTTPSTTHE